jgi:homoserine O-acetyltransferase
MAPQGETASSLSIFDRPAETSPAREGVWEIPGPFALHFGGELHGVRVAWRLAGTGPVVAALGGISAGRYVDAECGAERTSTIHGWWSEVIGAGRPLDTREYSVLGFDYLGGSGQTTGPQTDARFPCISSFDQVEILRRLLNHLSLPSLHAIVGASYGGMVALAFAQRYPDLVRHIVAISAADRPHPMSTAWRSVQREIVRFGLAHRAGPEGLKLARALAMATYRSPAEFAARFSGEPERLEDRFQFPVETYLFARGDAYAQSYLPRSFVCLSESIDLHQVEATQIRVPTTLVSVREDQLVPLEDMRALYGKLAGQRELVEISSLYGHDAFLKEAQQLRPVLARALKESVQ